MAVVGGLFHSLGQEADAVGSAYALDRSPLEDYVLPQSSDIVMALRKLAAY